MEEHIKSRHAGLPAPMEVPVNSAYRSENRCQCNACGKICTDAMELNLHGRICTEGQRLDLPGKNGSKNNKIMDSSEASSIASDDDSKDYRYS